jgi:hypothetical protein
MTSTLQRITLIFGVALAAVAMPANMAGAAKSDDGAVKALKQQYAQLADGQYDLAYRSLHPAQQALFSQDDFVACYQRIFSGVNFEAKVGDVKKTYRTTIRVPGTDVRAKATSVTYELEVAAGSGKKETGTTTTPEG